MDTFLKIKRINDLIGKEANAKFKKMDLTFSQSHAIAYLSHRPDNAAPLKDMEHHFQVAQATMAGIVVRLEQKHFVESYACPQDRRVKMVRLTDEGRCFCQQVECSFREKEKEITACYTDEELKCFQEYLDRLYQNLTEDMDLKNDPPIGGKQ